MIYLSDKYHDDPYTVVSRKLFEETAVAYRRHNRIGMMVAVNDDNIEQVGQRLDNVFRFRYPRFESFNEIQPEKRTDFIFAILYFFSVKELRGEISTCLSVLETRGPIIKIKEIE